MLMPSESEDESNHMMMAEHDERDSDLFPDIDVEIHEGEIGCTRPPFALALSHPNPRPNPRSYNTDFNGSNSRRRHSSDPDLPPGLPPLGEGIPSSPSKARTSSLKSDSGGVKNRTSSLDSAGGVPGKAKKMRSMAFGFYDEKRLKQTRLMR